MPCASAPRHCSYSAFFGGRHPHHVSAVGAECVGLDQDGAAGGEPSPGEWVRMSRGDRESDGVEAALPAVYIGDSNAP